MHRNSGRVSWARSSSVVWEIVFAVMNDVRTEASVRRLIRRKGTREYFNGEGWTQNPAEAKSFGDSLEAAQVCAAKGLIDVELALIVEGQQHHEMFCTAIR